MEERVKGFHLFKCPCDVVNPIMESQLEFGRGRGVSEGVGGSEKCAVFPAGSIISFSGCV